MKKLDSEVALEILIFTVEVIVSRNLTPDELQSIRDRFEKAMCRKSVAYDAILSGDSRMFSIAFSLSYEFSDDCLSKEEFRTLWVKSIYKKIDVQLGLAENHERNIREREEMYKNGVPAGHNSKMGYISPYANFGGMGTGKGSR